MMWGDYDCAMCAYMEGSADKHGKFKCECARKSGTLADKDGRVYADSSARNCDRFLEGRIDSYGQKAKREISRDARRHGYYVVTAVTNILGLPEDNRYMMTFQYIRNVIMPSEEQYSALIEYYEKNGPRIAEAINNYENKEEFAQGIIDEYLDQFATMVESKQNFEAILFYFRMLTDLTVRLEVETEQIHVRSLKSDEE